MLPQTAARSLVAFHSVSAIESLDGPGADRLQGGSGRDTFDSSDDPSEYLDREPHDLVALIVSIPAPPNE